MLKTCNSLNIIQTIVYSIISLFQKSSTDKVKKRIYNLSEYKDSPKTRLVKTPSVIKYIYIGPLFCISFILSILSINSNYILNLPVKKG